MASPTQWIWVWVNSRSWRWTGRPGVLWFMGLQRVGHDWATEVDWTGHSGCILSPCLFNLYADYIKWKARLYDSQAGIKTAERNINNLKCADDSTLMAESKEKLKSLWSEGERGEWKSCLKTQHSENEDHGIQSHHFMANSWANKGNSGWLYFSGLQNHCRWWLQPWN